ncbi:uncharacterized protein LOC125377992 [Haliotis rufescens]|uniref:uncharacterized protein LOC125377992 n=1 Tax=Haliotis rufescens TaxID=6454 RepID=UPI00201F52F7|nr:uncharacterized protein LOC125377992 [Haliotis rufescens]
MSSQAAPKSKPASKPKGGTVKKRPVFVGRRGAGGPPGSKPLSIAVTAVIGLGFVGGGIGMIVYSDHNNTTTDFVIIGGCMIVFGLMFLGVASVFVIKPLYLQRRVQAVIDEKAREDAALGVDDYVGGQGLSVNVADGAKQRRPSAVDLYYGDGGVEIPVRGHPDTLPRPPPPLVALPGNDRHKQLVPTFQAPLPSEPQNNENISRQ